MGGSSRPAGPTDQETRSEADAPRGRIMLRQGLTSDIFGHSDSLQSHLDCCMSCRSCERVCPAKVPYGELIDAGRAMLATQYVPASRLTRWLAPWLTSATLRDRTSVV